MRSATGKAAEIPAVLRGVRGRVDEVLAVFLERQRSEVAGAHPDGSILVDEIARVVASGGKRLRPAFCYWGFRAAGGSDGGPIIRVAAALELLHTFALIHDDVMDRTERRRGVPATHVHLAGRHRSEARRGDAAWYGISAAVLVGDIAAVMADRLLLESGFPAGLLHDARRHYDRMRVEMAIGQYLDVREGEGEDQELIHRIASLKTGSYTVKGPLHIGAALAAAQPETMTTLTRYADPLGRAFQIRDDLLDAEEDGGRSRAGNEQSARLVGELVAEACAALDAGALEAEAIGALRSLARLISLPTR